MSDMAANTTGHQQTDHLRTIGLVEAAYEFAKEVLADDGIFIAKVFQGGAEGSLLADAKKTLKRSGTANLTPADRVRRKRISSVRDFAAVCVKKRKASL